MKNTFFFIVIVTFFSTVVIAQESSAYRMPMLGDIAPQFTAESTFGSITFPDETSLKWTILFSHPADFTAVCSSEILELAAMQEQFNALNTRLMVISTDAVSSHIEWVKSLETIRFNGREPVKINFPLISDKLFDISKKYGMIHPAISSTKDIRGVFIIDPESKIQAISFYPANVGRNMAEVLRTLVALQTAEQHDVLIPANWNPGKDVMLPSPQTIEEAEKMAGKKSEDIYSITWYMWFKKLKNVR